MKIVTFLLFFPLLLFSQTWQPSIDITISEQLSYEDEIDLYTNTDGSHVLVHARSEVAYYLFSYNGYLVRSSTIISGIYENQYTAKISGYGDKVYISYKNGNKIYTKRSLNAGQTWSTNIADIQMNNSGGCSLDLACDENGLHIVWDEEHSIYPENHSTFYRRLDHQFDYWQDHKKVTYDNYNGGIPVVSTSPNQVHVVYMDRYQRQNRRDRNNGNWLETTFISTGEPGALVSANDKLHYFYHNDGQSTTYKLHYVNSNFGLTNWSTDLVLDNYVDDRNLVDVSVSANDNMHVSYNTTNRKLYYRKNNGSWSSRFNYGSGDSHSISANGNDIYLIWNVFGHELKLKHKDYPPTKPQNLSVVPYNNHPYLTWSENIELDVLYYEIWKKGGDEGGDWHLKTTTSNNYYEDPNETVVTGPAVSNEGKAYYKIKAVDINDNRSVFSDQAEIRIRLEAPAKRTANGFAASVDKYMVFSNYPNPFNPATIIEYQIPEIGFVELVVYDLLGRKVSTIVNEIKSEGSYQVKFNGNNFPSGVYIYVLRVNDFVQYRKMTLMK